MFVEIVRLFAQFLLKDSGFQRRAVGRQVDKDGVCFVDFEKGLSTQSENTPNIHKVKGLVLHNVTSPQKFRKILLILIFPICQFQSVSGNCSVCLSLLLTVSLFLYIYIFFLSISL